MPVNTNEILVAAMRELQLHFLSAAPQLLSQANTEVLPCKNMLQ
jgi:hypothetical protein